jgi:tRNA A-37 threonylcarbamoyl transferase component Bud32
MKSTADSQHLRNSGRNLEVPFRLFLKSDGSSVELICESIARIIPGKRLVCIGKWNDKPVVVKIFLSPKSAGRHCDREIKGVNALKNAGIKTPALLFQGNLLQDGTPLLVFERIIPAHNPQEAVLKAKTDEKRCELLKQITVVIAEQHETGLKQKDLHLGNFLLSGNDIYTIDGDTVDTRQMGTPLPKAKSMKNIGLYFAQFDSNFDHLFFAVFQVYAGKRSWHADKSLFNDLLKEVKFQRKNRKKKYLNKIFRECTAFVCHKSWNSHMVCDRNFYYGEMKKLIADLDSAIDANRLLKDGNSSTVALAKVNNKLLVVKRYNIKNFIHALKRCARNTRAWSSWRNAHRLESLGIPTPKPIAFFEKRCGPFRSTSYYISEYIDGTDLYRLITSDKSKEISIEVLSKRFGKILKSLADAYMSHGDFKATNFIVTEDRLFIIDIEGMKEYRLKWRFKKALKRDCERFMRNWEGMPKVARIFQDKIKLFMMPAGIEYSIFLLNCGCLYLLHLT